MSFIDQFASRLVSPRAAGIARVAIGVAAILKALERAPVIERLAQPDVLGTPYITGQPSIVGVPTELVLLTWIALGVAFALGAYTTIVGASLTALLAAVLLSDQQLYSNHLYLLTCLVGLLTLARSGAALSVDEQRGRGKAAIPAWPLDLVRLQVIVVYLFAGISKINLGYLSGSVVATSLRREGPLAFPQEWMTFEVMATLAVMSILAEVGLAAGLAVRRWRRTAFVVGLGLHTTIALWFEPTIPLLIFAVISLAPYVVFLDAPPRGLTVVWDDSCSFCRGWVTWFRRLDWLNVLELVPNSDDEALRRLRVSRREADEALQLVAQEGRSQGFRAVVGVLETLPVSFLWAPLLRLWPVTRLGDRAYRRIALRRSCALTPPAA